MSRASMNTQVWHGNITGPDGGLKARTVMKRGNDREASEDNCASTPYSTVDSNVEDAGATQDTLPPAVDQADNTGVQEE